MSFPQMAFGGIRSRRLAIASSDLIINAIALTSAVGTVKNTDSNLIVSEPIFSTNVTTIKPANSDLAVSPVGINANITDVKTASSELEVSPAEIVVQSSAISIAASDLVLPVVNLEALSSMVTPPEINLMYSSNGDASGYFYYVGASGGIYANPVPSVIYGTLSSNLEASSRLVQNLTDRASSEAHTLNLSNSWAGWRLHAPTTINSYTLRQRNLAGERFLRQWVLEGSNNVGANTVSGFNSASWTALDSRSDSSWFSQNAYKNFSVTGATPYQYIRLRQNGTNSNGDNFLVFGEIELYGVTSVFP